LEELSPVQHFIIARDQAYLKCVLFGGDRPADLGRVKVPEILRFPNDDGFLFNHIWGKTLRDGDENVPIFSIKRWTPNKRRVYRAESKINAPRR